MSSPRVLAGSLALGSVLFCFVAAALAAQPMAVSPGTDKGGVIGEVCPTFSWAAVPGATGYQIVVYWADEDPEAVEPVLEHRIAGSALSWTPTLERCLPRGGRYAWSVRALGTGDEPVWSAPNLFELPLQVINDDLEVRGKLTVNPGSGLARIEIEDPQGQTWQINTVADDWTVEDMETGNDVFWIVDGAPNASLVVGADGNVAIGAFGAATKLHVFGDATIEGDVAMGSSRELKTDLAPVETGEVLTKLAQLPIRSWRFANDSRQARHIGPLAEEFSAAFGFGADEKHISSVDMAGVAYAAIQGLHGEVERLRAQNMGLRVTALAALLTSAFSLAGLVVLARRL